MKTKISSLFSGWLKPSARAVTDTPYEGASHLNPDLARFRPRNFSAQGAISVDRDLLTARIHDIARNDGWASAGVARMVDAAIGTGWWLSASPVAEALNLTTDEGESLATQFETHWRLYANDPDAWCDAAERRTVGGMMALAMRTQMLDGEVLGVLHWLERPGAPYATALELIDPDRLSTPNARPDNANLRDGVEIGDRGEPIAYWIRVNHPDDIIPVANVLRWERIPRKKPWGRRIVIHHFEDARPGAVRGVSPFATIVKKLKMISKHDEAELQAAVLNAMLAAYVESPLDHEQLADMMDDSSGGKLDGYNQLRLAYWRDAPPLSIPGVKLNFLFPGEKINISQANRPNPGFEMFQRAALRNIASALGISYEQLSMDWSQVNYSSARAALLEVWKGLTARSGFFGHGVVQPWYAAFLEEIIETGKVKLPRKCPPFREAKAAYCNARWIGPGRGWVDPLKEAEAAIARIEGGLSTLERECAEQGLDWREVMKQQSREDKFAESLGLPKIHDRPPPVKKAGGIRDQPEKEQA